MRSLKRFQGFTLIELLVVVSVIMILIGILLQGNPSIERCVGATRRVGPDAGRTAVTFGKSYRSSLSVNRLVPGGAINDRIVFLPRKRDI